MSKTKRTTLMANALAIFIQVYNNKNGESCRQRVLSQFQSKLNMKFYKAQTYYNHCETKMREAEQALAEERAAAGKPVWTAFKIDGKKGSTTVSNAGSFLTLKAAREFNATYEHHGVVKGLVKSGDVVDSSTIKIPAKVKTAKPAVKAKVKAKAKTAKPKAKAKRSTKKAA